MHNKPFINGLRSHRVNAGLRQIDAARLLELDCADRLSRWENGSAVPHIMNLFKLAALYEVPPEKLYEELFQRVSGRSARPSL